MDRFPTRQKIRLEGYDYSSPGAYFITICAKDRACLFWETNNNLTTPDDIVLSAVGKLIDTYIKTIECTYDFVTLDCSCVMYDHVHLLLTIHSEARCTVGTIVNQLKRKVSMEAGTSVWQKGYYDHIIRDENDFKRRYTYIENNPLHYILRDEW